MAIYQAKVHTPKEVEKKEETPATGGDKTTTAPATGGDKTTTATTTAGK